MLSDVVNAVAVIVLVGCYGLAPFMLTSFVFHILHSIRSMGNTVCGLLVSPSFFNPSSFVPPPCKMSSLHIFIEVTDRKRDIRSSVRPNTMELFAAASFPLSSRHKPKKYQDLDYQVLQYQQIRWYLNSVGSIIVNSTSWNLLLQYVASGKNKDYMSLVRTPTSDGTAVLLEVMFYPQMLQARDYPKKEFNMLCFLFLMEDIQNAKGRFPVEVRSNRKTLPQQHTWFSCSIPWRGLHLDLVSRTAEHEAKLMSVYTNSIRGTVVCSSVEKYLENITKSSVLVVGKPGEKRYWSSKIPKQMSVCTVTQLAKQNKCESLDLVISSKDLVGQCLTLIPKYRRTVLLLPNPQSSLRRDTVLSSYYRAVGVPENIMDSVDDDPSGILFYNVTSILLDVSLLPKQDSKQLQQVQQQEV